MRAASGSPKAALSEPAGQKKQPVSSAAVPPLRSAGRIIEKLREFNTFSPCPSIPRPKKDAALTESFYFGRHSFFYTKMQLNCPLFLYYVNKDIKALDYAIDEAGAEKYNTSV